LPKIAHVPDSGSEPFLDVQTLIERSMPRPRISWLGYAAGLILLIALSGAYVSWRIPAFAGVADFVSKLAFVVIMVGLALLTSQLVRRQRDEIKRVEALEEMVQLRRWPEAAGESQALLAAPMRTLQGRAQTLIYLSSILTRYGRFQDAVLVQNYLLDTIHFDDSTAHGLRLGRAMAMLREDHLVDADRAISELRRSSGGRGSATGAGAGLALVQLYRDVKTGHPGEAIEHFNTFLPVMRQQLGHRVADAHVLVARAYDLLGRSNEAQDAYRKATLLAPMSELSRRYPEVVLLESRYQAAETPAGLGGAS
jgi:tetratricopeptide (TPR) repeat protein